MVNWFIAPEITSLYALTDNYERVHWMSYLSKWWRGSLWLPPSTCLLLKRLTNSCTIFTHNALHGGDDLLHNRRWHWCGIHSAVRVYPQVINQFLAKHRRHQILPSQHLEQCFIVMSSPHNKTGHQKKPLISWKRTGTSRIDFTVQVISTWRANNRSMTTHNYAMGQDCVFNKDKPVRQICLANTTSTGLQQGICITKAVHRLCFKSVYCNSGSIK